MLQTIFRLGPPAIGKLFPHIPGQLPARIHRVDSPGNDPRDEPGIPLPGSPLAVASANTSDDPGVRVPISSGWLGLRSHNSRRMQSAVHPGPECGAPISHRAITMIDPTNRLHFPPEHTAGPGAGCMGIFITPSHDFFQRGRVHHLPLQRGVLKHS